GVEIRRDLEFFVKKLHFLHPLKFKGADLAAQVVVADGVQSALGSWLDKIRRKITGFRLAAAVGAVPYTQFAAFGPRLRNFFKHFHKVVINRVLSQRFGGKRDM